MSPKDRAVYRLAALACAIITSLAALFGVLRGTVSDMNNEIGILTDHITYLRAISKGPVYYEILENRLTTNEVKINSCLEGK